MRPRSLDGFLAVMLVLIGAYTFLLWTGEEFAGGVLGIGIAGIVFGYLIAEGGAVVAWLRGESESE